jgi:hypothetical protein
VREEAEVEVGSSAGFILDVGLATPYELASTRPRGRRAPERPEDRGLGCPDQGLLFPEAESPTCRILVFS